MNPLNLGGFFDAHFEGGQTMRIIIEGTKDEIAAILRLEESPPQVDVEKIAETLSTLLSDAMKSPAHTT